MSADPAVLAFLQQRNSAPRLTTPAPNEQEFDQMLRCALRSPDHAWLRPWRFISFRGERREVFSQLLLASVLRRNPEADQAVRDKALGAALRAPLVVAVMAVIETHPKVPAWEQRISAGCAAFSLSLAAEALGYASVWRTGDYAGDARLLEDLGCAANEECVGFLYIGTRDGTPKAIPELSPGDFHRSW
ncbi:MAG: nitroreductase family protein [Congregibacter sp.]